MEYRLLQKLSSANKISVGRAAAVPLFVFFIQDRQTLHIAGWLFLFLALTDALDGYIARKLKRESKIGSLLDPLADKLLLIFAYWGLYKIALLPYWVSAFLIGRCIILGGGGLILFLKRNLPVTPTKLGKVTIFFEMLLVLLFLFGFVDVSRILLHVVIFLCMWSLMDYLLRFFKE